jgi:hypothetical protein
MLGLAWRLLPQARHAPLAVLVPTTALLIVELYRLLRRPASSTLVDLEDAASIDKQISGARRASRGNVDGITRRRRELVFLAWLGALIGGIVLVGPALGAPAFLLGWLFLQARQGWIWGMAAATAAAVIVGIILPRAIGLRLPSGLLTSLFGLP